MKEFILGMPIWGWITIGIILICIIILVFVNKNIRKLILSLVIEAEQTITGSKKGQEKLALVIERLHNLLPKFLQIIFTETYIKKLIENAVLLMKKELENLQSNE